MYGFIEIDFLAMTPSVIKKIKFREKKLKIVY